MSSRPSRQLRHWVTMYSGNRMSGFDPGIHRALPTASVVVVLGLGQPISVDDDHGQKSLRSPTSGLRTGPATITHDGSAFDVTVEMTPAGAEALLGTSARALSDTIVDLDDVIGREAAEWTERLHEAESWGQRFSFLDNVLCSKLEEANPPPTAVAYAWDRLVSSGGRLSVSDLAHEVGYSRRQLYQRFVADYGVPPKVAGRIVRFERSTALLRTAQRRRRATGRGKGDSLSGIAMMSGFHDQAHMTREWGQLAGCSPSRWLSEEELPFVQDPNRQWLHNR